MTSSELQAELSKIRPHTSSNLAHQKKPAQLLAALESTIQSTSGGSDTSISTSSSSSAAPTASAYFASLLTTLEGTIARNETSLNEGDILPATIYLLAIVTPFVPPPLLRSQHSTFLPILIPLLPHTHPHAPSLRSLITILCAFISSLDTHSLDAPGVRNVFGTVVEHTIDPRPKVRHKAAEAVRDILSRPPSPLQAHPWRVRVSEWANAVLEAQKGEPETLIRLVAFLKMLAPGLIAREHLKTFTTRLLALPRLSNPYLTQAAYSLLTSMLSSESDEIDVDEAKEIASYVLEGMVANPPSKQDVQLAPYWLSVLGKASLTAFSPILSSSLGMDLDSRTPSAAPHVDLPSAWNLAFTYLESTPTIRKSAEEALIQLTQCIPPLVPQPPKSLLHTLDDGLTSLAYAPALGNTLRTLASFIMAFAAPSSDIVKKSSARAYFRDVVRKVGEMRVKKGFEHREGTDAVFCAFARTAGVDGLLSVLPLNLVPKEREELETDTTARAFLLPLLASLRSHGTPLAHFTQNFLPLIDRLTDLAIGPESHPTTTKVWSVLADQCWSTLPAYCSNPPDLTVAFGRELSERLTKELYANPALRPPILRGLRNIVESQTQVQTEGEKVESETEERKKNLGYLRGQAKNWLAVLFNVFASVGRGERAQVGEVIGVWAGVAGENELAVAYRSVLGHLNASLAAIRTNPDQSHQKEMEGKAKTALQMLDILFILTPYLPAMQKAEVIDVVVRGGVLDASEGAVQKVGMRLVRQLVDLGGEGVLTAVGGVSGLLERLAAVDGAGAAGGGKDRVTLIATLIPLLPPTSLHLVVSFLMEAILSAKDPSEKVRRAAFALLVTMGQKMKAGGVVDVSLLEGVTGNSGATGAREANVQEFVGMVGASLAAEKDHTISAGVMALSRVLFEFRGDLSPEYLTSILTAVNPLLSARNREVVKSVLGFVKLCVHSLPAEVVQPQLVDIVRGLIGCLTTHRVLKVKIRHILERTIRRFGYDYVIQYTTDLEDGHKVLVNIRKRRDRAKRKKAPPAAGASKEQEQTARTGEDAFENVIYGSESEIDSEEEEKGNAQPKRPLKTALKRSNSSARLRVDGDDPMDLLEGVGAHGLTSLHDKRRRKPGQEASKFKTDSETGRMIIDDDNSDSDVPHSKSKPEYVDANLYKESLTSVDGFTRGPNGKVKFHKDTKKRRREEMSEDNVEMADVAVKETASQSKKRNGFKVGQEFKAKRAGGDVKKNGMEPYAYVALGQVIGGKRARKGGVSAPRVSITGRR